MGNSPNNQPTVANEKWLTEGRKIHKQYRFTFFFASFLGTIICTPLSIIFVGFVVPLPMHVIGTDTVEAWGAFDRPEHLWIFAPIVMICIPLLMMSFGPLYGGLCYMGLQSMRGRKPRIRDIFRGFERFWGTLFLWLIFPTGVLILVSTGVGVFIVPLLWAVAMLAFPLLIDQKLSTIAAMSTAFQTVLTWKNWWRFWLFGLVLALLACIGIVAFCVGIFITLPLAICAQMIAYREIFKPEETLLKESTPPGDQYSSPLKAQYIWTHFTDTGTSR